jgi:tricorn protease
MFTHRPLVYLLTVALPLLPAPAASQSDPGELGFYRFPALHGNTIVFAAEGDLWRVSADGGVAQRITTHPGEERWPVVSPNGRTLAFTAQYEGPPEVYTMPLSGGTPVLRFRGRGQQPASSCTAPFATPVCQRLDSCVWILRAA